MEDTSLMNPGHLKSEINDTEELIAQLSEERTQMKERGRQIIRYMTDTHNRGESSTLTHEQVSELIGFLSDYNLLAFRFAESRKFTLKVYKRLLKDRRWIVGSKLRFLKKK